MSLPTRRLATQSPWVDPLIHHSTECAYVERELYRRGHEFRTGRLTVEAVGLVGGPTDRFQPGPMRLDRDDAGQDTLYLS